MACHHINGGVIARPSTHLVDIHSAKTPVSQKCQLGARSGPDLLTMWVTLGIFTNKKEGAEPTDDLKDVGIIMKVLKRFMTT